MTVLEYIQSRPSELQAAIDEFPAAYAPLGSLEWHDLHLPLGFDGLKAETLLRKVMDRIDEGIFSWTMYWLNYGAMNLSATPVCSCFTTIGKLNPAMKLNKTINVRGTIDLYNRPL